MQSMKLDLRVNNLEPFMPLLSNYIGQDEKIADNALV